MALWVLPRKSFWVRSRFTEPRVEPGKRVFVIIVVSSKTGLTRLDKGYLQNEVLGNVNLSLSIIVNTERLQDFSWFSNMSWIFDFACCWCIDCYKSHWPARSTAFPWTFGVLLRPSLSWPLIRCFSRHGGMRVDEVELFSRCQRLDLAFLKDVTLWQGERECFWFTSNSDKTESWKWWPDFSLEICNAFAILQSVLSVFDTYFLNATSLYHFEIWSA